MSIATMRSKYSASTICAIRSRRIDELDRIANDGRLRFDILNRPTESHFDTRWSLSCITLAWLAGNPAFEEMVAQTGRANYAGPSPDNAVQVLARHLRANVAPLSTRAT